MSRRAKSAKGEVVDFDLLTIKAQIAAGKATKAAEEPVIEVKRQENFIDKKIKRHIAKTKTVVDQIDTVEVHPKPFDGK